MKPDLEQIRSPDFWSEAWEMSRTASPYEAKKIRSEEDSMKFWDGTASNYGKMSQGGPGGRVEQITGILDTGRLLTPESSVLDVGSGPGVFALPFARKVRSVTAVDGSGEMVRILNEKAREQGLKNVMAVQRLWRDVDLEKEGWAGAFDLVFASLTPAVNGRETLVKMNLASRGHCCLVVSAGGEGKLLRHELWKRLFHEDMGVHSDQPAFVFNLLNRSGFLPEVRNCKSTWVREQSVDAAVEALCRSFWMYMEITNEARRTIARFVEENSENGIFREEIVTDMAVITWKVK